MNNGVISTEQEQTVEQETQSNIYEEPRRKKRGAFISKPLLKQTFKSTWVFWLIMTLGSAAVFMVVNIVMGSKNIFVNIEMGPVSQYVKDQELGWLQVLGLLERMGFSLSRIQVMSQIDLNTILNDLIYRIAGVLLPMVYIMVVANKVIVSQVSDGSMAYVLSTPTNRKVVVRTQFFYLLISLIAMYLAITVSVLLSEVVAGLISGNMNIIPLKSILYCFASFCAMFALMGICFGASAFFNRSSCSIAIGGGICLFSFLCCILGLFGNKVFVSVGVGVAAMNVFNYMSIFSLIDMDSISAFTQMTYGQDVANPYAWIWKVAILIVIGIIFAIIGAKRFEKKDLPL